MNIDAVQDYLTRREGRTVSIASVQRASGGLSRETWFVRGDALAYIFRCDLRGGISSCPVPLRFEYEMHRRLPDLGLPVARALWFEEDAAALGQPFYVRECVEGTSVVPGSGLSGPARDDALIAASREHIQRMAAVHQADWRGAALDELMPPPSDAVHCAIANVERLRAQHQRLGLPLSPMLARAFDWFSERAPQSAPTVALCKGSNGAMQEVWRDGRIVALCDWELASIGDPASDWARCWGLLPTIEGRWDRRAAMDYYAELTGWAISDEALAFYGGLYWLEMAIVGLYAGRAVRSGALLDVRLSFLENFAGHMAEVKLAEMIIGQAA